MIPLTIPMFTVIWKSSMLAIPAAIVGRYNRSDQVSLGRGTVIAIVKMSNDA